MLKLVTRGKSDVFDPHTGESLVLLDEKMVGTVYMPTKLLVLPDGEIALLLGYRDQWRIWSEDEELGQCVSEAYSNKAVAEPLWQKLCAQLTGDIKRALANRLADASDEQTRMEILGEITRLQLADDALYETPDDEIRASNLELWDAFKERHDSCLKMARGQKCE